MADLSVKFVIKESSNSFALYLEVEGCKKEGSLSGYLLNNINSQTLKTITQNKFIVSEVKDFGFGVFGREVIDPENNICIAKYSGNGSWRMSGMSERNYDKLYILNYIKTFYLRSNTDQRKLNDEIERFQSQFVISLKKLKSIIDLYEKEVSYKIDIKSLTSKSFKI